MDWRKCRVWCLMGRLTNLCYLQVICIQLYVFQQLELINGNTLWLAVVCACTLLHSKGRGLRITVWTSMDYILRLDLKTDFSKLAIFFFSSLTTSQLHASQSCLMLCPAKCLRLQSFLIRHSKYIYTQGILNNLPQSRYILRHGDSGDSSLYRHHGACIY